MALIIPSLLNGDGVTGAEHVTLTRFSCELLDMGTYPLHSVTLEVIFTDSYLLKKLEQSRAPSLPHTGGWLLPRPDFTG